ncbi:Wadjet anti-phage system protein JetD domain-containing protein [Subtercola endophyticus]|uniref:Wadjet anti-phage system protein JetD domain-containing protein n=1 Tax=Subtercola endophyticus TaxID=2895559 RepID=UPI001E4CC402|nr:Wadjet anti-phage system protein JetD domain-containing protein [Subtercola endophyticus]UFS57578.1 DUF2220 family protein [Subtercola endophyticus]
MITLREAREKVRKRVARDLSEWATTSGADAEVSLPLHPPTERAALADIDRAVAWRAAWLGVEGVDWIQRRWASIGTQEVPERLTLRGADAIAEFTGMTREWKVLRQRAVRLQAELPAGAPLNAAIRTFGAQLLALPDDDFDRLVGVLQWLAEHPSAGWRPRQLPIRGVDSKWVGSHRGMITGLHAAVTGRSSLDLLEPPPLIRVRFLDPHLRPGGLDYAAISLSELVDLSICPSQVLVLENLETLLSLPEMTDTVALHGAGFGAHERVGVVPWVRSSSVRYWGDLDSHGFAILNELRHALPEATSILMDERTLLDHRDLWVPEPKPALGSYPLLTEPEQQTLATLRSTGSPRLEQERIDWAYALARL